MSALMHLPENELQDAMRNIAEVLSPGAPLFVGLWGGDRGGIVSDRGIEGRRRLFCLRSHDANADRLSTAGRTEWSATHNVRSTEWEYHMFRIRQRGESAEPHVRRDRKAADASPSSARLISIGYLTVPYRAASSSASIAASTARAAAAPLSIW